MGIRIGIGNILVGAGTGSTALDVRMFDVVLVDPDGVDLQTAHITWTATALYETEIYKSLDGAAFALLTTVAPGIGVYDDQLMDGDEHTVKYYARHKDDNTVLSVPAGFTAVEITGGVRLNCDDVTDATSYEWWGSINGAATALIATTAASTYDHIISVGNTIIYKVRAREGTLPVYSDYTSTITVALQILDADGNVYTTVVIGTQTWLVENLKTTKYNDGSSIAHLNSNADRLNDITGYFEYANTDANNLQFGLMYNSYAINNAKGLSIAGFHIATSAEWGTLVTQLGGAAVAGKAMKETGTTYWANNNGTDTAGFKLRGGGRCVVTSGAVSEFKTSVYMCAKNGATLTTWLIYNTLDGITNQGAWGSLSPFIRLIKD